MKFIDEIYLIEFLNNHDYDIRESHNARWIDQKCTPDVLCIIADCILEYEKNHEDEYFTSMDIWHSDYTINNVISIFKKPNPDGDEARNEYDKFFQQPMELFAYAGILTKDKRGKNNFYKVSNKEILEYISIKEMFALTFLNLYIEKVLKDSNMFSYFNAFFDNPNVNTYFRMKSRFVADTIQYTSINKETEPKRIFTKIINPMSFYRNTYGSESGRLSKDKITKDMLMYNRNNFRDIYSSKPKEMTRNEFLATIKERPSESYIAYQTAKAKKLLRSFNDLFNGGRSEIQDGDTEYASEMHHIFPVNEFKELSDYIENMIALTPNQHYLKAHPNRNTQIINRVYQQLCLITKAKHIEDNILSGEKVIYDFDNFIFVLSTGFDDSRFNDIEKMNFNDVIQLINLEYE